jgi:hypothetical protein
MTSSFDFEWETVILICFYYGIAAPAKKTGWKSSAAMIESLLQRQRDNSQG